MSTHCNNHRWALVLAAGSGTRLSSLTTDAAGEPVPKQFCSLNGGASLLRRTLDRAFRVVPWSRTLVVVAEQHRRHWQDTLPELPAANVIVQPRNRGTAIGILLPLLHILDRDPEAEVVLLPSDHHVDDEDVFADAVRTALDAVDDDITLLGITPDGADAELGYIVAESQISAGARKDVRCFIEKPCQETARRLVADGALWNSFVIVAAAHAIVDAMHQRHASVVEALRCATAAPSHPVRLAAIYAGLPALDFSRDVVTPLAARVKCLPVPSCGWTDLGTPQRVAQCLARLQHVRQEPASVRHAVVLDLAEAHRRRQRRPVTVPDPLPDQQLAGELL